VGLKSVQDAIITALKEISDIGYVDDAIGRVRGLPWEHQQGKNLPLWVVTLGTPSVPGERHQASMLGIRIWDLTWDIRGYMLHSFEGHSEDTWMDRLDDVMDKLKADPAISVCSHTEPPSLVEHDLVHYGGQTGAPIVHYARFTFPTRLHQALGGL